MDIVMGSGQINQNDPMKKKPFGTVQLSNRCVETQAQIFNVLQVMGMTSSALGRSMFAPEEERSGKMTEGQIALEATLIAACERMDAILKDPARWDDSFQRKVEKEYEELHALQSSTLEAQRKAAAELTSPHFRYRPDLKRLVDGRWMAILGHEDELQFAIYGIGNSAQEALEDFDAVFTKGIPKSLLPYLSEREQALESGEQTPPFPKQNEQQ
jgi:hypothetical protein